MPGPYPTSPFFFSPSRRVPARTTELDASLKCRALFDVYHRGQVGAEEKECGSEISPVYNNVQLILVFPYTIYTANGCWCTYLACPSTLFTCDLSGNYLSGSPSTEICKNQLIFEYGSCSTWENSSTSCQSGIILVLALAVSWLLISEQYTWQNSDSSLMHFGHMHMNYS